MSYNGWRNRETWLVNIWFNPVTKSDIDWIQEHLEDQYYTSEALQGFWNDMIHFNAIDWDELREAMEDEEEEE
tara:strand:- start:107 stop:325 length:219 start_codon:yes stop_codon:yes gene_type:complete